jgi:hypothetical protein
LPAGLLVGSSQFPQQTPDTGIGDLFFTVSEATFSNALVCASGRIIIHDPTLGDRRVEMPEIGCASTPSSSHYLLWNIMTTGGELYGSLQAQVRAGGAGGRKPQDLAESR